MDHEEWDLLSNRGKVFACISRNQHSTAQVIAQEVHLSLRAVQKIIAELEREGYFKRYKTGRCNSYILLA
jgi:DNA-binding Lrp family transcriptional regulator